MTDTHIDQELNDPPINALGYHFGRHVSHTSDEIRSQWDDC